MKLGTRHEQAAMLIATGEKNVEVARRIGVRETTVWQWTQRPDFSQLVERYREKLLAETGACLKEKLAADGPRNLRFLVETRNGDFDDDEKRMGVRLKASQILFDRQVPKREEAEAGGVTIILNTETMKRIEKAQAEELEFEESE